MSNDKIKKGDIIYRLIENKDGTTKFEELTVISAGSKYFTVADTENRRYSNSKFGINDLRLVTEYSGLAYGLTKSKEEYLAKKELNAKIAKIKKFFHSYHWSNLLDKENIETIYKMVEHFNV